VRKADRGGEKAERRKSVTEIKRNGEKEVWLVMTAVYRERSEKHAQTIERLSQDRKAAHG
jgi:hypothetical protein